MAFVPLELLLLAFLFYTPSLCLAQCPKNLKNCDCIERGVAGSPSFTKTVDCSGKLGELDVAPDIPTDTTHL